MYHLPSARFDDPDAIATALGTAGACLLASFPSDSGPLREDLLRLQASDGLQRAAVGRAEGKRLQDDIRGDSTLWLDDPRCAAAATAHLSRLDSLRIELNRRLFLGLSEVEAHYAAYPAGAFYRRHRDRFRDSDARVVSLVSYLNTDWSTGDGGMLRLYLPDQAIVDVVPQENCSICFLSEIEHEVLPATRPRYSIAAWMRRA